MRQILNYGASILVQLYLLVLCPITYANTSGRKTDDKISPTTNMSFEKNKLQLDECKDHNLAEDLRDKSMSSFVENRGQVIDKYGNAHPEVLFTYNNEYACIMFTKNKIYIDIRKGLEIRSPRMCGAMIGELQDRDTSKRELTLEEVFRAQKKNYENRHFSIEFLGASQNCKVEMGEFLPVFTTIYMIGHSNGVEVKSFKQAVFKGIYPGVDWRLTFIDDRIESKFVCKSSKSLSKVRIKVNGAYARVDKLGGIEAINSNGEFHITDRNDKENFVRFENVSEGVFRFKRKAPFVDTIEVKHKIFWYNNGIVDNTIANMESRLDVFGVFEKGFPVSYFPLENEVPYYGRYNMPLVYKKSKDGRILWSTQIMQYKALDFYGSVSDSSGNTFIVSKVNNGLSNPFEVANPKVLIDSGLSSFNSFLAVIKLDKGGKLINYSLSDIQVSNNCDKVKYLLNSHGDLFVFSFIEDSTSFLNSSKVSVFSNQGVILKINNEGRFLWSRKLPMCLEDEVKGYFVDSDDYLCITGTTKCRRHQAEGLMYRNVHNDQNLVVMKVDKEGSIVYYSNIGGSGDDEVTSSAVAKDGTIWICGRTKSLDFPTVKAFQSKPTDLSSEHGDGFVTKIDRTGRVSFSSYYWGLHFEYIEISELDSVGCLYLNARAFLPYFPYLSKSINFDKENQFSSVLMKLDFVGNRLWLSPLRSEYPGFYFDKFKLLHFVKLNLRDSINIKLKNLTLRDSLILKSYSTSLKDVKFYNNQPHKAIPLNNISAPLPYKIVSLFSDSVNPKGFESHFDRYSEYYFAIKLSYIDRKEDNSNAEQIKLFLKDNGNFLYRESMSVSNHLITQTHFVYTDSSLAITNGSKEFVSDLLFKRLGTSKFYFDSLGRVIRFIIVSRFSKDIVDSFHLNYDLKSNLSSIDCFKLERNDFFRVSTILSKARWFVKTNKKGFITQLDLDFLNSFRFVRDGYNRITTVWQKSQYSDTSMVFKELKYPIGFNLPNSSSVPKLARLDGLSYIFDQLKCSPEFWPVLAVPIEEVTFGTRPQKYSAECYSVLGTNSIGFPMILSKRHDNSNIGFVNSFYRLLKCYYPYLEEFSR